MPATYIYIYKTPDVFKFSPGFGRERGRKIRGLQCIPLHQKSNIVETGENDWDIARLMRVDINNN